MMSAQRLTVVELHKASPESAPFWLGLRPDSQAFEHRIRLSFTSENLVDLPSVVASIESERAVARNMPETDLGSPSSNDRPSPGDADWTSLLIPVYEEAARDLTLCPGLYLPVLLGHEDGQPAVIRLDSGQGLHFEGTAFVPASKRIAGESPLWARASTVLGGARFQHSARIGVIHDWVGSPTQWA